jgi:hypothetical protein
MGAVKGYKKGYKKFLKKYYIDLQQFDFISICSRKKKLNNPVVGT